METSEMKPIVLIGVFHSFETLELAKQQIDEHAKKGDLIGFELEDTPSVEEARKEFLRRGLRRKALQFGLQAVRQQLKNPPYFEQLKQYAQGKGVRTVVVDSATARHAIERKTTIEMLLAVQDRIEGRISESEYEKKARAILKKTDYRITNLAKARARFMVGRIKLLKPDIVIVGERHARLIQEAVPIKKRIEITVKRPFMRRALSEIRWQSLVLHRKVVKAKRRMFGRRGGAKRPVR